jgi:hypothetical protein
MWKTDPKGKHIYKFKHNHIYMLAIVGLFGQLRGGEREEKRMIESK